MEELIALTEQETLKIRDFFRFLLLNARLDNGIFYYTHLGRDYQMSWYVKSPDYISMCFLLNAPDYTLMFYPFSPVKPAETMDYRGNKHFEHHIDLKNLPHLADIMLFVKYHRKWNFAEAMKDIESISTALWYVLFGIDCYFAIMGEEKNLQRDLILLMMDDDFSQSPHPAGHRR